MDIFTSYLLLVLLVSMLFGAFAQSSQFCPVGGLRETINKQGSHRLWGYVAAIAVALIAVNLLEFFNWVDINEVKPNYRSEEFAYGRYILGGFIFGFGMVLSAGCGMRNLVRVGQGSLKALLVVAVMAITAYFMVKTSLYADAFMPWITPFSIQFSSAGTQELAGLLFGDIDALDWARLILAFVIGLPILFFAFQNETFRQVRYWLASLVIGLVIAAGFYITGAETGQALLEEAEFMDSPPLGLAVQSFSFAAPMADTVYALMNAEGMAVITFGVVAVLGLPLGAFLASVLRKEFVFEVGFSNKKEMTFSLIGAVMVGIGSVLAMGCSVGHGLTGISTLALGSMLALTAIAAGAYAGIKLERVLK